MKALIEKLNDIVVSRKNAEGSFVRFNNGDFKAVELSKNGFKPINNTNSSKSIAFVDGGNSEILGSADFSLQLIRIFGIVFKENKKIKSEMSEFFVLVESLDGDILKTSIFQRRGSKLIEDIEFSRLDESIGEKKEKASCQNVGSLIRRLAELRFADLIDADYIILDGSLEAKHEYEEKSLNRLFNKNISGISKTCGLITDNGISAIKALTNMMPKNEWSYLIGKGRFDVYIAKLNKASRYCFRADIKTDNGDEFFGLLKQNANDAIFPGYPYGLILADKFARISNQERNYFKSLITAKLDEKSLRESINTLNAHEVLDSISY